MALSCIISEIFNVEKYRDPGACTRCSETAVSLSLVHSFGTVYQRLYTVPTRNSQKLKEEERLTTHLFGVAETVVH